MSDAWPIVGLGDHVDLQAGHAFESTKFTEDPDDIPLVKGSNVHQGFIDWASAKRWPAEEFDQYEKFKLAEGDVVLAMDRPWISSGLKYAWIGKADPKCLLVQRVARLRGRNGLITSYLRFLVGGVMFEDYIRPITTGVNVPHISGKQIGGYRFKLPPIVVQRKIVSILSTFDDLIQNNTRRIQILEDMVEAIYREWFVHMRYPGHEDVPILDSGTDIGDVPEGWAVNNLGEICELVIGQSPKSDFYNQSGEGLPFHQGVSNFGKRFPTHKVYCTVTKRVANSGDILFSVRAPVGRLNIADTELVVGRGLHSIRHRERFQEFLYQQLKMRFFEDDLMGGGTIFKSVTKSDMLSLELIQPPTQLTSSFEGLIQPLTGLIRNLAAQDHLLTGCRDMLLPKLISGQLDVSHMEIPVQRGEWQGVAEASLDGS